MLQFYNSCTVLNKVHQCLVNPRRHGLKPLPLEVKRKRGKGARIYSNSYIVLGFNRWTSLAQTYKMKPHGEKLGVGVFHYILP